MFHAGGTICAWPGCPMGRGFDEKDERGVYITELGEGYDVRFLPLSTLRFHQLELNTREDAIAVLTHLRKDFWIHRLTGDSPGDLLVAPLWVRKKDPVLFGVGRRMAARGLSQGCYYTGKEYPVIEKP
jgi:hypothetical protein